MPTPSAQLPLRYNAGADLREKLNQAAKRVELLQLFARVGGVLPIEFTDDSQEMIPLRAAWRVCIRYDCPVVEVVQDADLNELGRTLSDVLRRQLGTRSFGYLSVFGQLPWVKIAITDPQSDWVDNIRNAGARDILFMTEDGKNLFAVIDEGHDPINLCISLTAAEVANLSHAIPARFTTTG